MVAVAGVPVGPAVVVVAAAAAAVPPLLPLLSPGRCGRGGRKTPRTCSCSSDTGTASPGTPPLGRRFCRGVGVL